MTLKHASRLEELAIEINGRFSELGIIDLIRAILIARWDRRRSTNRTSALTPWLHRDLGISDDQE